MMKCSLTVDYKCLLLISLNCLIAFHISIVGLTSSRFGRCHETEAGVSVGSQDLGRWLSPRGACAGAGPAARQQQIANPCCQPSGHMTSGRQAERIKVLREIYEMILV